MKTPQTIPAASLAVVLVSCIAFGQAAKEPSRLAPERPLATRFEQFSARTGRIFIKTTYEGRDILTGEASIQVRGVSLGAPGETDRVFAVVLESRGRGTSGNSASAVLDFDEAVSLLAALESMRKIGVQMASEPSANYTEVTFETKGDFQAGYFQQAGKQTAFVRLERYGSDGVRFGGIGLLDALKSSVSGVLEQLRVVGAR